MEKKDRKYILNYKNGIKLFLVLIFIAIIIFGIFYFIQEKKDREFELGRPNIETFTSSLKNNE